MDKPQWYFNELLSGENPVEYVAGEFFSLEALKNEALPREAGQNSLDQVLIGKKLKLKIEIHEKSKKSISDSKFLKGLYDHCSSRESGIPTHLLPDPDKKFRYMVIEDFNTTGVIGDINFNNILGHDNQNYFNLFRSIGMTSKDSDNTDTMGSWGIGKNMYAQVSAVSAFLGYTCREETPVELLTGMSILKLHTVDGVGYKNIGNYGYGNSDNNELVMPIDQRELIEEFKSEFNITRSSSNEHGLSLVVPCLRDEIIAENIIKAFVKTWSLAILKDKMEIHLKSGDTDIIIDKDSLGDHLNYFEPTEKRIIEKSIHFLQKSIELNDDGYFSLNYRDMDRPIWTMGQLLDDEMTAEAKEQLESEKAHIAFKIPVKIAYNNDDPKEGEFRVHIFRDSEISNPYSIQYYRGMLLIPGVLPDRPLNKPYHAVIFVDGVLADIFAKAEGPAHYQWSDGISKFQKLDLKAGLSLINFVRNSAVKIKSHLNQSDIERDDDIASQILGYSMPSTGPGSTNVSVDDDETEVDPPDPPDGPIKPRYSPKYSELSDGFSFRDNPEMDDDKVINKKHKLGVSYLIEEGNPHRQYKEDQFNLKKPPIRLEGSGIEILYNDKNHLEFIVNERNWTLKVRGFDSQHRELQINFN